MTIIVDRPRYHIETADPKAKRERKGCDAILKVVRKGDGAFFHMDSAASGPALDLLWRYAHGDDELPSLADGWIDFFVSHDPDWTYPEAHALPVA